MSSATSISLKVWAKKGGCALYTAKYGSFFYEMSIPSLGKQGVTKSRAETKLPHTTHFMLF